MKIRTSFVSNSSSSSFICDISGEKYTGRDAELEDAEMFECKHWHIFCDKYLVGEYKHGEDYVYRCGIPENNCPICSFIEIAEDNLIVYISKVYHITYDEVYIYMKEKNSRLRKVRNIYWFELLSKNKLLSKIDLIKEIKNKFNNLKDFEMFIKQKS